MVVTQPSSNLQLYCVCVMCVNVYVVLQRYQVFDIVDIGNKVIFTKSVTTTGITYLSISIRAMPHRSIYVPSVLDTVSNRDLSELILVNIAEGGYANPSLLAVHK